MVDQHCNVKIADFGLVRSINGLEIEEEKKMTGYVASRWYRAPEILLGSTDYGESADMWAVGCIFAEMLSGEVLFKGSSTLDQLEKIFSCLPIVEEDLEAINSPVAMTLIQAINCKITKELESYFLEEQEYTFKLLEAMLEVNPEKRISAVEALKHPFMSSCLVDEPVKYKNNF